jgi:hypothetical protein
MRKPLFFFACILVAACSPPGRVRPGKTPSGSPPPATGTLSVEPSDVTLDLVSGQPAPSTKFLAIFHASKGDQDVTMSAGFVLTDTTLGQMVDNQFTASLDHGGSTSLTVNYKLANGNVVSSQALIHVKVHGSFTAGCPGCSAFPADSAPACGAATPPKVVYPPDGVLLPPNLNQLEVQFLPGTAGATYEVDFENAATDVRVQTKCVGTVDTHQMPSGGCFIDLDADTWNFIAKSNRGGDAVKVTARVSSDGICATPSNNSANVSFTNDDVAGAIYYWKSVVGQDITGGAIWRKGFGDTKPEEQITVVTGTGWDATCYGCHSLSRDGKRMIVNADDGDSDDEYSDVKSGLVDVASKMFITTVTYDTGQAAGFQTFNQDHSLYLGSNGDGSGNRMHGGTGTGGPSNVFFLWNGQNGTAATPGAAMVGPSSSRPTMPDWSVDDKNVVFVMPTKIANSGFSGSGDDMHVFGGSLWVLPYNGNGSFGAASALITSQGENNYYPSYSPDGSFILFNRVPLTGSVASIDTCDTTSHVCANDSFSNPKARVWMIPTKAGAAPIDLEALNGSPAAKPVPVSNSWPRWSPFVQMYKGSKLLWVTFSSTRDYGLRVNNHATVGGQAMYQCYPPETPENDGSQTYSPSCQQPQLWMAAINLSNAEVSSGDPSYPAFWVPFQDITTHNHSAQWTTTIVTGPTTGSCTEGGKSCTTPDTANCCGSLICTANGTCGVP